MAEGKSAALLLRVWLEDDGETFRARLLAPSATSAEETTIAIAASPRDLMVALGQWLDEFLDDGPEQVYSAE